MTTSLRENTQKKPIANLHLKAEKTAYPEWKVTGVIRSTKKHNRSGVSGLAASPVSVVCVCEAREARDEENRPCELACYSDDLVSAANLC